MSDQSFPILSVDDLVGAQRFYEAFGFSQTYRFPPDGEAVFVTLERAGCAIGLGAAGGDEPDRFALWIYVENADDAFETARSEGAAVVAEPRDEPWGERVASVRDPDGNLVHLGTTTT